MKEFEKHKKDVIDKTWNFSGRLVTAQDHFLNAAFGVAGEAGEVADEHKKLFFHNPKDRRENIVNEFGDLFYYTIKLLDLHGITVEECLAANKKKLYERHGIQ
ncbi:MAG TPA: MazG nucleotide pyrophosphohydrolase domain-containing protein [Anaerovoracaceae bacterium]|nr:MazG nucleotide pyrophosphohydrolase domain-containing protein [Anaerovoracaceae bacterium]